MYTPVGMRGILPMVHPGYERYLLYGTPVGMVGYTLIHYPGMVGYARIYHPGSIGSIPPCVYAILPHPGYTHHPCTWHDRAGYVDHGIQVREERLPGSTLRLIRREGASARLKDLLPVRFGIVLCAELLPSSR